LESNKVVPELFAVPYVAAESFRSRFISYTKTGRLAALVELQETNQLNERKSGFIDFISHEFAAPLQNIRSISELIHLKLKSANTANMATTVLTSIRQVDNEVARLTVLIADVILLEKLSNNQIQLQPSPLDVYKQLRACTARIEVQQQDGRVAFVDVRGSRELVPVDAQYFDMAMGKLLCNAFKYSVGNPSPMVIIQFKASDIEIKILDFGIGVPVGERDKLFSGFFRCSNVGYIEGVGLGLAIAKKIMVMHGGNIRFEAKADGTSAFIATLPYRENGLVE
jgi:signal transduction histidine kinase